MLLSIKTRFQRYSRTKRVPLRRTKKHIVFFTNRFFLQKSKEDYTHDTDMHVVIDTGINIEKSYPVRLSDKPSDNQRIRAVLKNLVMDCQKYSNEHPDKRSDHQHPRATIVTCSDSRVQLSEFDQTAEEDLFVVRNIGNQHDLCKGSIRYGIDHLKTPLLLYVGHSNCGAVLTAWKLEKEKNEEPPKNEKKLELHKDIEDELKSIKIEKNISYNQAIIDNVHNQVQKAMEAGFKRDVTVIGAIYDFRDDFGRGANQLIFINVNGKKLEKKELLDDELQKYFGACIYPIIGTGELQEDKKISKHLMIDVRQKSKL